MPTIQALIFDLDDTLIDTAGQLLEPAHIEAATAMIQAGLAGSIEDVSQRRIELGRAHPGQSVDLLTAQSFGCTDPEEARAGHDAFYRRTVTRLDPFPEAPAILEALAPDRRLFLVTVGHPATQQTKVELTGLARHFEAIRYVDIAAPDKQPAIAELLTGIDPARAVVVGDRIDGELEAGRRLGCWTVRVDRGEGRWLRPKNPFQQPHYTIPGVEALPAILADIELGDGDPSPQG